MFDGSYHIDTAAPVADPLTFLAALARRLDRSDRHIRRQIEAIEERVDVLAARLTLLGAA